MNSDRVLVFSDLDGTLINHDNYGVEAALPVLERLQSEGITVILNTSKTKAEVIAWQRLLGLSAPFVVENGAAVWVPRSFFQNEDPLSGGGWQLTPEGDFWFFVLGKTRSAYVTFLEGLPCADMLSSFHQWTIEEIEEKTGLSRDFSALAAQREYSEPFILKDPQCLPLLMDQAEHFGYALTRGGRFWHLTMAGQNKATAMVLLQELFSSMEGGSFRTVALGDNFNDVEMLQAADVAFQIPQVSGHVQRLPVGHVVLASQPGAAGWAQVMENWLAQRAQESAR